MKHLLIPILLLLCISGNSTNYYFAANGDDTRTTTQARSPATPWKTISKITSLATGDSALFRCNDTFLVGVPVTAGIKISSYSTGAQPYFTGFVPVTSWTDIGNGIWESNALATGSTVNCVVLNGKMYAMGRYPNADASNGGYLSYEAVGTSSISDNSGMPPAVNNATWANATLVIRVNHYVMERTTISSITGTTIAYSPATASTPTANFGYFIENDIDALDQYGEWFYNTGTKKIDMYFGDAAPTSATIVQVSAKDVLIEPRANNTSINNIHFEGANTYCVWNWNAGVSGLSITNCTFIFAGMDAISMENRAALVIRNSKISWCNGNGICMANKDDKPVIDSNDISYIGLFPGMLQRSQFSSNRYAVGILHIPSSGFIGMQCTNNNVHDIGGHGIFLDGDSMYIYHNRVKKFCKTIDDDGGIYTGNIANVVRKGIRIIENIVSEGVGAHFGTDGTRDYAEGIYLDDGTNNVLVQRNTSFSNANTGIFLHNARKNTIINNTCYDNFQQLAIIHGTQISITIDSNIVTADTFFSLSSSQLVQYRAKDQSFNESFQSYTLRCDSNVYCSPFTSDNSMLQTNWFGHSQQISYDLPGWRAALAADTHTTATPITVTNKKQIVFLFATAAPQAVRYCKPVVTTSNTSVTGSNPIPPYNSQIRLSTTNILP